MPDDTVIAGFVTDVGSVSTIVAVPESSPSTASPPETPLTWTENDSSPSTSPSGSTGTLIVVCNAPAGTVTDRGDDGVPHRVKSEPAVAVPSTVWNDTTTGATAGSDKYTGTNTDPVNASRSRPD